LKDDADRTYPIELEIKDTTDIDTSRSVSYHDLHLEIGSEGCLRMKLYDKDDYNFPIVNYLLICSNITVTPTSRHSQHG
jgi:hypothetical protein